MKLIQVLIGIYVCLCGSIFSLVSMERSAQGLQEKLYADLFVAFKNKSSSSTLKMLLKKIKNKNARDKYGCTFLHYAVCARNREMIEYLLKNGAAVDFRGALKMTPLHCACWLGYSDLVKVLLENGANCNIQDDEGMTPLHYAALFSFSDSILYLTLYRASQTINDKNGFNPVYYAVQSGLDTVKKKIESRIKKYPLLG